MEKLYRAKAIRFESGERFPMLVDELAVPVIDVLDYSLAYHRDISVNAGLARIGAIGLFMDWANHWQIDLKERFGSGDLFSQAEVESLAGMLGQSKRKTVTLGNKVLPGSVLGDTQALRVDWVKAFIRWSATNVIQAMRIADARVQVMSQRLEQIETQLENLKKSGAGKVRLGLTEEQQVRLFQIVRPGSPENPFHRETRHRNFMLFLLYFELGTRKAEPLVLKPQHVHVHGMQPRIIIIPNSDDPEEMRKDPPLVKTAGRTLPISKRLATAIHIYITEHRSQTAGAKKNPFIILESTEGRAMSLDSVYDLFVVVRDRFPNDFASDFSTHVMRHTWNDRFRAAARAAKLPPALEKQINNYLMGWTKTSLQSANYSQREVEQQDARLMFAMQQQLEGVVS
jgi:integrase